MSASANACTPRRTGRPSYGGYSSGWHAQTESARVRPDEPEIPAFVNTRQQPPVQPARPVYAQPQRPDLEPQAAPEPMPERGGAGSDVPAYLRRPPKR